MSYSLTKVREHTREFVLAMWVLIQGLQIVNDLLSRKSNYQNDYLNVIYVLILKFPYKTLDHVYSLVVILQIAK